MTDLSSRRSCKFMQDAPNAVGQMSELFGWLKEVLSCIAHILVYVVQNVALSILK